MIVIDYQNRKPIYRTDCGTPPDLNYHRRDRARRQPDAVRPFFLPRDLSINPEYDSKAYSVLEQEGYITPVKGRVVLCFGKQ